MSNSDVLIIGAGPVGLTLANELVRHGVTPRIVDKSERVREVSKALILHVRTQEILDKVGIMARVQDEAEPLREVVVHAYGQQIGGWDLDRIDSPYPHPLILGQNRTQHILQDQLGSRGVRVEYGLDATALDLQENEAAVTLRSGERTECISARYVVGCDGSNSLVRRAMGASFDGERYSGEQFIQADCRIRWGLPKGRSYLFLTPDGYMMAIEMPGDVVRIFISLPDEPGSAGAAAADHQIGAVEATNEPPTLDEIRHHLMRLSGFESTLSEASWLARYRTSHRYADRFQDRCAFIAGDAGHVHVPIGGQGMNTGLQDAFNLGWKLAGVIKGVLQPNILETYQSERHPVAVGLIRGTNLAYRGVLHPGKLRQYATRFFGPFLIRNRRVQEFMRGTLEELRISYSSSRLNLDLGGSSGPAPGERVLDATLVRLDDLSTTSINALTRTTRWTLFIFAGADDAERAQDLFRPYQEVAARWPEAIDCYLVIRSAPTAAVPRSRLLLDHLGEAHRRYGVGEPAFVLLRPDTYVTARGPLARRSDLASYLETIFVD